MSRYTPIRNSALTECLKRHKFVKQDDLNGDERTLWEHKDDMNLTVAIYGDSVGVEIYGFVDVQRPDGDKKKIAEDAVVEIDRQVGLFNKRLEQFHALQAEILAWCKSVGVVGKFVQNKIDPENFEFRIKAFKDDALFVLAFRGQDPFVLEIDYNEHQVDTLDSVTPYLLGYEFSDWPGELAKFVVKGKSIFTWGNVGDLRPFFYRYGGMTSIKEHEATVTRVTEDPVLAQLMEGQASDTQTYWELRFRFKVNAKNFEQVRTGQVRFFDLTAEETAQ
uniref:Uncharacterized protein n=1 Tax=Pseudomonas phage HRDY3 TaxID=3236930 RepID=A0AB39CDQ9_9VIRU